MKKSRLAVATAAAAVAALALGAAPASADDHDSIVDIAIAASGGGAPDTNPNDYDLLVQAVLYAGLDGALDDPSASLTVFAPTDAAFLRLVTDLTGTAPASEADALATIATAYTPAEVGNILLYHAVAGEVTFPGAVRAGAVTMANGGTVTVRGVNLRDETPALADPKIVVKASNIFASNGVIHTIDRVLVPGS
ncbi:fasciclin domain-containing protein [Microbacterium aureliae]